MEIWFIGGFETSEVGFEELKSIVGVEESSSFGLYFLVTFAILDFVDGLYLLFGDLVDGKFVYSVDGVIENFFVFFHFFEIFLEGEDYVLAVFLSGSSLDLDVAFHAEWSVKGDNEVAAGNIKSFFSDTGGDQDSVLLLFELN